MWVKGCTTFTWYALCMNTKWLPLIDQQRCTGCGDCIEQCPEKALALVADKAVLAYPEQCSYCQICEDLCPADAIDLPFLVCFGSTLSLVPRGSA